MIDFIKNGKSVYTIVCGNDVCERFAAKELQIFVEKSTKVLLPIVETPNGPFISIGQTPYSKELELTAKWKKHTNDGIRLMEKDGNLYLFGKRPRSTLYAVYDFLETFFGVRFLASDETFVPERDSVRIDGLDKAEEPAFDIRSFYTVQMEKDSLYTARLRQVALYSEEVAEYGYGLYKDGLVDAHNVFEYLPFEKYSETNPEFFYPFLYDHGAYGYDLCYSQGIDENGEIEEGGSADILSKNLIEKIKTRSDLSWFSVCQNDVPVGCPCQKCQENAKKYGGYSGILLRYINAVARRVEKWRHENCPKRLVKLVTFAYAYTEQPPISETGEILVRPESNVWMWLATAEQNMLYSCGEKGQNAKFTELFESWSKITDRFCYWDYRVNFAEYLFYFPGLRIFEEDFRWFEKKGIEYLFCEAASGSMKDPDLWFNEVRAYVAAKLMWNTSLSAEGLLREFCQLYYGEHANAVLDVINGFEDNFERVKKENPNARIYHMLGYRTLEEDYYPVKMLEKAIAQLKKAIEKCSEERLRAKLYRVLCTPQRMLLRNYAEYYPNDKLGKEKLYQEFLTNCKKAGISVLGGYEFTIENLEKYPDYNWFKMNNIPY